MCIIMKSGDTQASNVRTSYSWTVQNSLVTMATGSKTGFKYKTNTEVYMG